ncbi:HdeD family acid-resistance protein [Cellulomonas sp. HZM]|uniref:HdeD family acid-resistance protein n=1 Tax=Cellulomonas sp. HZM TaxID=1454010 RepID=UPI000AB86708|nr:DUF308 domain-containing protein [Cellulomonas sp. HZM]
MSAQSATTLVRSRSGWDVILGILLLVGGFIVLGDVVVATVVSVYVLAWTALIGGIVLLVSAITKIRAGGALWAAIGGAILLVFGIFVLRNPLLGAVALTVMAGALFLTGGIARLVAAFSVPGNRVLLAVSGVAGVLLGGYVLINPGAATLTLLGVLLGVQLLVEGITLVALGRLVAAPATAETTPPLPTSRPEKPAAAQPMADGVDPLTKD